MKYYLLLLLFTNSLSAQITLTNNQIGIIETNKGSGSGFIFQKSNLIFTAAHVVNGTTDISYDAIPVRGDRSLSPNFHNLKIIKIDLDFDYAILKSKDSISQQVFYPSPDFNLKIGQLVYYIGFDTVQTIKSKIPTMAIAAARIIKIDSVVIKNKVIKYFEFYGDGVPGYSGGPILNTNNQIVGFMKAFRYDTNSKIIDIGYSVMPAIN